MSTDVLCLLTSHAAVLSTGRPEDRIGLLCDLSCRNTDAAHHQPLGLAQVLFSLHEEPHQRSDSFPEEGLPGTLLLHQLSHRIAPCSENLQDLPQLPKVSSAGVIIPDFLTQLKFSRIGILYPYFLISFSQVDTSTSGRHSVS